MAALDSAEEMLGLRPLADAADAAGIPSGLVALPDEYEGVIRQVLARVRSEAERAVAAGATLDVEVDLPDEFVDVISWFGPRADAIAGLARRGDTPARWTEALDALAELFETTFRAIVDDLAPAEGARVVKVVSPALDVRRAGEVFARGLEALERLRAAGMLEELLADVADDAARAVEFFGDVRDLAMGQWAAAVAEGRTEVELEFEISPDDALAAIALSRRVRELIGDFEVMRAAGGVPLDTSDLEFIRALSDGGEAALQRALETG